MILVIDNYDSFTYNLVQYFGELGCEIIVHRNDQLTLADIERLRPDHIVISPGPGEPDDAGISLAVVERFHRTTPILGVCLGHQVIGQAFGGKIKRAGNLMHGKTSLIEHDGQGVFAGIPSPFRATRYHSLIVDEGLPECVVVNARTPEGELMGLRHTTYPTVGVQFHPESILTEHGHLLLKNFLEVRKMTTVQSSNPKPAAAPASPESDAPAANPIKAAIAKMMERKHLREDEAEVVMTQIMNGEATSAQIGAYLTALRMKGETVPEITGSARAMRNAAVKVLPATTDLVDTCGTGGDGSGTFNISTTAAFVVVGAGQSVAKHGNRSISSKAGSADVLEALGVNLDLTPEQVADCIDAVGLGFMFAPRLHPAMRHAIGPRRELAVRTIFNLLGPLTNPAGVLAQVIGVYDGDLTHTIAEVLGGLGSKAAFVVHGYGGLDEMTTSGPTTVSMLQNGQVTTTELHPDDLGFPLARLEDLFGGDAQRNAVIARNILAGEDRSPRRDVVLLNAAAALLVGGKAKTLKEGVALADESIKQGAAMGVLENLVAFTQKFTAS
jgi:anthranilate synthase/phosphoribosyltransferase